MHQDQSTSLLSDREDSCNRTAANTKAEQTHRVRAFDLYGQQLQPQL